jgi:hypothetical protein
MLNHDIVLITDLDKRLEQLRAEFPVCIWLKEKFEMNRSDKLKRENTINFSDCSRNSLTYKE